MILYNLDIGELKAKGQLIFLFESSRHKIIEVLFIYNFCLACDWRMQRIGITLQMSASAG